MKRVRWSLGLLGVYDIEFTTHSHMQIDHSAQAHRLRTFDQSYANYMLDRNTSSPNLSPSNECLGTFWR